MAGPSTLDAPSGDAGEERDWLDDDHHFIDDVDDFLFGGEVDERRFAPVYPWVTIALFTTCAAVCTSLWLGIGSASPSPADITRLGGISGAALDNGEWWKLLASAFVHAGPLHLCLNMLFILAIGAPFERVTGHMFTAVLIVVGAIGSSLGGALINPTQVGAGASGIAFAIMGATIVLDPLGRTGLGRIARWMLLANIVLGFVVSGTNSLAHISGLVAGGIVAAPAYRLIDGTRDRTWLPVGCVVFAAAALAAITHPAIAEPLGIDIGYDRPVSKRIVESQIRRAAEDRPYQAAVNAVSCTEQGGDGSRWQCGLRLTPITGSGEPARAESWIANVDEDGNIGFIPAPETALHVEGMLRDWGLDDREHSIGSADCESLRETGRWGCILTGARGQDPFSEYWAVHVAADGSWRRTAMFPTADGLEATIRSRGLRRADGVRLGIQSARCRDVSGSRRIWRCAIREAGAAATVTYHVHATPNGSWRLASS